MQAVLLTGRGIEVAEVPSPTLGPGQVELAIEAAGLCHSDLTLAGRDPDVHPFALPLVLGHEFAGTVVGVGAGVTAWNVGDRVVSFGPVGCDSCRACRRGEENHCRAPVLRPAGLGQPGGLAERVVVDARAVVANPGLSGEQAAVLADAGLTTFHAVRRTVRAGDMVLVIGVGGLGHLAPALALAQGASEVLVVDRDRAKVARCAAQSGVRGFVDNPELVAQVLDATGGRGVDVVVDFVGRDATLALAPRVLVPGGVLSIVGVSTDRLPIGAFALPLGCRVDVPYWGNRDDLVELLAFAASGGLTAEVEPITLEQVPEGYRRLDSGRVDGRLVARPGGVG